MLAVSGFKIILMMRANLFFALNFLGSEVVRSRAFIYEGARRRPLNVKG